MGPKPIIKSKFAGFTLMSSVLIILAIAILAISIGYLVSINLSAAATTNRDFHVARHAAESCVEIALNELLLNDTYPAGDTFVIGAESCDITQITGSGNVDREISAESIVGESTVKITVNVDILRPNVIIGEWQITN